MDEIVTVKTRRCLYCGEEGEVQAPSLGIELWGDGAYIQDALPTLTAGEREQLLSGTHPTCWDALMKFEVEQEEEDE